MSAQDETDKLAERLARVKPPEAQPRRHYRIHPHALSGLTAIAGVGIGAWLVLAAPEAPEPAPALETASVSAFQEEALGAEGFSPLPRKPATTAPVNAKTETARLSAEIAALKAENEALKDQAAAPVDAEIEALKSDVAALTAEAAARKTAIDLLEEQNARLQGELEARAQIDADAETEANRLRAEELARKRQEAEALSEAQVHSDMIALRAGSGSGTGGDTGWETGPSTSTTGETAASGGDAFRLAGATAAEMREAEIIANPGFTIMQGTLIEATLETAIDTDLPGNVAALVSHDVWSFDMSRVLIPRGSRLFGRYESDPALGQRRVLIAWDRLVTTDGQSVSLAAFGSDQIGRSGLPGTVRRHFLQRFGSAALISVIGAVPAIAAARYQDDAVVSDTVENVGTDLGDAVNDVMADYLTIPPTISVDQGAVVMVRVDADLEFR